MAPIKIPHIQCFMLSTFLTFSPPRLASAQSPSSCRSTNVQMTGCESGAMSVLLWCYKGLKYRVFLLPDDMNKNIPGQTKYPSNYLVMD